MPIFFLSGLGVPSQSPEPYLGVAGTTEPRGKRADRGLFCQAEGSCWAGILHSAFCFLLSGSFQAFESLLGLSDILLPRIAPEMTGGDRASSEMPEPKAGPNPHSQSSGSGSQPCYHRPHQKAGRGLPSCQHKAAWRYETLGV